MAKLRKVIYWIATLWLALGMASTGAVQLMRAKTGQGSLEQMAHLGYPVYLLTILGIWKILGVVAVLVPKVPRLKEWAYAGFFFAMTGAIVSHLVSGDPITATFPALLLLMLTLASWYLRPASRKLGALVDN